jgi:phosphoribosylaminoimidazole-succinocarboxamide synthase
MSVLAELHAKGKVRDIYEAGDNLLMVASDRISAFDVILPTAIPDKGRVLTGLSVFWFARTADLVPNHLLTADVDEFPEFFAEHSDELAGRGMLVKRAQVVPIECVARGYLSGSGWKEYQKAGAVCGVALPAGLSESDRLPEPIFTPSTKATEGHDENITLEQAAEIVG